MADRIDAILAVGSVSASVSVTGEAPILRTDSAEVSETLRANEINRLSTFGRNITRLSLLAGGVSMPGGQLDRALKPRLGMAILFRECCVVGLESGLPLQSVWT